MDDADGMDGLIESYGKLSSPSERKGRDDESSSRDDLLCSSAASEALASLAKAQRMQGAPTRRSAAGVDDALLGLDSAASKFVRRARRALALDGREPLQTRIDGLCQYHSLQLAGWNVASDYAVRVAIADEMTANDALYDTSWTDGDYTTFVNLLRIAEPDASQRAAMWGNQVTLMAAANASGLTIRVTGQHPNGAIFHFNVAPSAGRASTGICVDVYVFPGLHYIAAVPRTRADYAASDDDDDAESDVDCNNMGECPAKQTSTFSTNTYTYTSARLHPRRRRCVSLYCALTRTHRPTVRFSRSRNDSEN
jgi:hypothetical protein